MKTNFYILLILLLSFSFGNAQRVSEVVNVKTSNTISNKDEMTTVNTKVNIIIENDLLLIDTIQVKKAVARGTSDIRNYLNHKRKVSNINLVFREINRIIRA